MEFSLIFKILFSVVFLYSLAPTFIVRLGGVGSLARVARGFSRVALTFDDGPDPKYTPQILEILHRYQVKACFFVVGSKVLAYPDLTRQILNEGHTIGNHGFRHKAIWLLSPGATRKDISDTNLAIEKLTGQMTVFYRPAWGLFNLFSIWYCWLKGLKVILWTYWSWDWIKKATPESICRNVLHRIKDGTIIILHDSDSAPGAAKGSTARMVEALPRILEGLEQKGLQVASLDEVVIHKKKLTFKKMLQQLWGLADHLVRVMSGIKEIPGCTTWRFALHTHHGSDWILYNGNVLKSGEPYLDLHANNDRFLALIDENTSVERSAIIAMREMLHNLPRLADFLQNDKRVEKVNIIMGITLLHRGLGRIGFTIVDMKPGIFKTLTGWYERWLLGIYHPGGFKKQKTYREKLSPKYVIITRQELMRHLPPTGTAPAVESHKAHWRDESRPTTD
jgi:peptidoglycan/xylan/chitin deacetylase (PgdA/CDA1 family)